VLHIIVALLFVANTINIGADLGAMADALGLLIGGPVLIYVVMFGLVCATLQVFMTYRRYVAVLRWLTLSLFAYFGTIMVVRIPWGDFPIWWRWPSSWRPQPRFTRPASPTFSLPRKQPKRCALLPDHLRLRCLHWALSEPACSPFLSWRDRGRLCRGGSQQVARGP
jgi:Natural resistance-associated macrophage protein